MKFALFDTALGTCGIVWTDVGICRLLLPERSRGRTLARVKDLHADAVEATPSRVVQRVIRHLTAQLDGGGKASQPALDLAGVSPFARRVYEALRAVPAGETVSYAELAARAGSPRAARAVGRAMATNPMPLLIPCHRVLAANGKPGGFTAYGGVATKAKLLALEGVKLDAPATTLPYDVKKASRHLGRVDPELAALMRQVGSARLQLERRTTTFAALAEAIVFQQLTGRAAATIFGRVCALFGNRKTLRPKDVAGASQEQLRSAGLSGAKAAALADLAAKTLAREIPTRRQLDGMSDEAIVASLTQVRGIGQWTVEMLLIFQLGRPDVLPLGDYAVRKAFGTTFGLADVATPKQLAAHGERWRPYRSLASWYLWRALEL